MPASSASVAGSATVMEPDTPAAAVWENGVGSLDRGQYSAKAFCSIVVPLITEEQAREDTFFLTGGTRDGNRGN